jgi:hypothetical protein
MRSKYKIEPVPLNPKNRPPEIQRWLVASYLREYFIKYSDNKKPHYKLIQEILQLVGQWSNKSEKTLIRSELKKREKWLKNYVGYWPPIEDLMRWYKKNKNKLS